MAECYIPEMGNERAIQFPGRGDKRRVRDDLENFDPESGFEMANLYPKTTGLSRTVFVSPRMGRHDIRIKVCLVPGDKMTADDTVNVALRPQLHQRADETKLPAEVMHEIALWIELNRCALVAYWEGEIDTAEFLKKHKKLRRRQARG